MADEYADDQQQLETDQTDTGAAEHGEDEQPASEQQASEQEAEGEDGGEPQDKPQKRNRPGKLERQIERQQREIAELKGFLQSFSQQQQGSGGQQQTFEQQAPKAPKYEDYDSEEAYIDALTDYKVQARLQQAETERERRERERQERQEQQKTQKALQTKLAEGAQKYDDFEDVVYDDSVPINQHMVEALADSDYAADIAYHLGSNPKEAQRIAQMTATKAAREIGRLESRFARPQQQQTQQTKAPEPTKRIRGGGDTAKKDPEKMTVDEWMEARRKGKI
jgi:hypothetical protein